MISRTQKSQAYVFIAKILKNNLQCPTLCIKWTIAKKQVANIKEKVWKERIVEQNYKLRGTSCSVLNYKLLEYHKNI